MWKKFGLELKQLNRSKGWGFSFYHILNVGNCTKETKLTVTFAIEAGNPAVPINLQGSVARPQRWINVRRVSGTTADNYDHSIASLVQKPYLQRRKSP